MRKKLIPVLGVLVLIVVGVVSVSIGQHSRVIATEPPPAQSSTPAEPTPEAKPAVAPEKNPDATTTPEPAPAITSPNEQEPPIGTEDIVDNILTQEELNIIFQKTWDSWSKHYKEIISLTGKLDDFGTLEDRLSMEYGTIEMKALEFKKELPVDYKELYIQWRPDESTLFDGIEAPDIQPPDTQPPVEVTKPSEEPKPNDEPYTPPTTQVEPQKPVETPSTPPPATQPPVETPPVETPPVETPPATQPPVETPSQDPATEEINQPPKDGEEGYIHYEDTQKYKTALGIYTDMVSAGFNDPTSWYNAVASGRSPIPNRYKYKGAGMVLSDQVAINRMQESLNNWHSPYDTEYWERYEYGINNSEYPDIQVGIGW